MSYQPKEKDNPMKSFLAIEKDKRLTPWHIALLSAIFVLGFEQDRKTAIRVSRNKIMLLSHIATLPTYHKYLTDLQILGYVRYRPSYHPGFRSEIDLTGNLTL